MPRKRTPKAVPLNQEQTSSKLQQTEEVSAGLNLLDLPEDILLTILSYISFHEVALLRVVSRGFDRICQVQLNRGFREVLTLSAKLQNYFESKLPRRKSKREEHPLYNHEFVAGDTNSEADKLFSALDDFVQKNQICYFAGKFTDEAIRVLRLVKLEQPLVDHPYDITLELTDLRVMAEEYFEKKLEPRLQKKISRTSSTSSTSESLFSEASESSDPPECGSRIIETGQSPLERIIVLEEKVRFLEEENKKVKDLEKRWKDQLEDLDKKWKERLEALEKRITDRTDPGEPAQAAKPAQTDELKTETAKIDLVEQAPKKQPPEKPDKDQANSETPDMAPTRSSRPRRSTRITPIASKVTSASPDDIEVTKSPSSTSEAATATPIDSDVTKIPHIGKELMPTSPMDTKEAGTNSSSSSRVTRNGRSKLNPAGGTVRPSAQPLNKKAKRAK